MVAGIVLLALGMKKTIVTSRTRSKTVPAVAMFGGMALYLLAHVAFRLRNIHTLNRQRRCARGCSWRSCLGGGVAVARTLAILAAVLGD